jgi:hypothetical protein
MDVLLDHNVPVPLVELLHGHAVRTAVQEGWDALSNGKLLAAAGARFDVLVTCDQNIVHQQNLSGRTIAIVAVSTNLWPVIRADPDRVKRAVDAATAGSYQAVNYPRVTLRRRSYPSRT